MPNKRRGKWAPFDALEGHRQSLAKVEQELEKIERPVLFEETKLLINESLIEAFHKQLCVEINYYYHGKITKVIGVIKQINNQYCFIDNQQLNILDICGIMIL